MVCATFWKIMAVFIKNETICSLILSYNLYLNSNKCSTFIEFGGASKKTLGISTSPIGVPAHWFAKMRFFPSNLWAMVCGTFWKNKMKDEKLHLPWM